MRKVILLTAMPKEGVWSSSIYVNGGSKVTFCVKHNLISTFFNFVFYCTLVFIMCFLTAGNICAQTTLPFDDGNGHLYGTNYEIKENGTENGTVVMFHDNTNNKPYAIGYSYVGGENWAATWIPGQTHTFTVTLKPHTLVQYDGKDVVGELHIVALDCELNKGYDSYLGHIVAEAWIDPLNNNTNNVLTLQVNQDYKAVCLFKTPRTNTSQSQWEYVKIASATCTVETSVVISESANNNITEINNETVELYRSLTANTWNTICLPFVPTPEQADAIFGEGAKFAEFSSVSNGVMQFKSVAGSLEAGKPYLVLPTKSQTASSPIKLTGVTIPDTAIEPTPVTYDGYSFIGIYRPTPFPINDQSIRFVAANNKLKYPSTANPSNPNESTPLKALRAYISLPGPDAQTPNLAKDYFEVDSFVPTSIANIQIDGDGDGAIYNIGGQRVEGKSLPKGIYIRDGKKFVVK